MTVSDGRVFVAGATGLAGSAVVRALLAKDPGNLVVAAHKGQGGAFVRSDRVEYRQADLTVAEDCLRASAGCAVAVLAAANTGGALVSRSEPWSQVTDNVVMDARLMDAMFRNGIRRVVYVSTASVYPEMDGFIREDQLDLNQEPHAAYLGVGWAKRYGEKACQFWHEKTGLEVMILRLANIFGPFARFDPRTSNFIPALIRKAVDGMDPFEVWGSPSVVRDVIYADDFGTAVVAALAATELKFDAFNIGSGTLTSVGSVVEAALSAANFRPSGIKYGEPTTDTLPYRVLDVSRAKRLLNWTPAVGPIEGIVRTVDWWKRNRDTWIR